MSSPNLKVLQQRYLDKLKHKYTILACHPHPEHKTWFIIWLRREDGAQRAMFYSPKARKGHRIMPVMTEED